MKHPKPTIAFELPVTSSHNIQTRIYHPPSLTLSSLPSPISSQPASPLPSPSPHPQQRKRKRVAVITHPYAPLGGSFDDPVVLDLVSLLLSRGDWIVVTGNFRGAPTHKGSVPGRTSWSGKPERAELETWLRFAVYYVDLVVGQQPSLTGDDNSDDTIDVLAAGYSYGSLVVSSLDTLDKVIDRGKDGKNSHEGNPIWKEAKRIADEYLTSLRARESSTRLSIDHASHHPISHLDGVGEDSPSDSGGRRSFSIESGLKMGGHAHHGQRPTLEEHPPHESKRKRIMHRVSGTHPSKRSVSEPMMTKLDAKHTSRTNETTIGDHSHDYKIRTAVLLVSPVLPPISTGLAISLSPGPILSDTPEKNTFVIYGGEDQFTSSKRVAKWVSDRSLQGVRGYECVSADHFWRGDGVSEELCFQVGVWLDTI